MRSAPCTTARADFRSMLHPEQCWRSPMPIGAGATRRGTERSGADSQRVVSGRVLRSGGRRFRRSRDRCQLVDAPDKVLVCLQCDGGEGRFFGRQRIRRARRHRVAVGGRPRQGAVLMVMGRRVARCVRRRVRWHAGHAGHAHNRIVGHRHVRHRHVCRVITREIARIAAAHHGGGEHGALQRNTQKPAKRNHD